MEVAILGKADDPRTQALLDTLWSAYRPRLVAAQSDYPPPEASPALLDDRRLLQERPTAYVCQNFLCRQPVNDPTQFLAQLDSTAQALQ